MRTSYAFLLVAFGGDLKKAGQWNRAFSNKVQVNGHMGHVTIRMGVLPCGIWILFCPCGCHSGVMRMIPSLMVKSLFFMKSVAHVNRTNFNLILAPTVHFQKVTAEIFSACVAVPWQQIIPSQWQIMMLTDRQSRNTKQATMWRCATADANMEC